MKRLLKFACLILGGLSIGLHALGAFGDGSWNYTPINVDSAPERLWSWVNSPPLYYADKLVTEIRQASAQLQAIIFDMPTGRDAPQQVAAFHDLISLVPGATVDLSQSITLQVTALNTGKAVWLARSAGERGVVRLGWRWFKGDQVIPTPVGWVPIQYDIIPGNQYKFTAVIALPREAGEYLLEVGLVNEHLAPFPAQNAPPLKIPVHVLGPPEGDFHEVLARGPRVMGDIPSLSIATDRPRYQRGNILTLTLDLVNSASRTADGYVALIAPHGIVSFWDGKDFSPYTKGAWVPLVRGARLDQGLQLTSQPLLSWQLADLAFGPYTVSLVLTEPNTPNIIAKAQATFMLEP